MKQTTRSATVAWIPAAPQRGCGGSGDGKARRQLLALGSMGMDPRLELAAVDLTSASPSLPIVASVCAASPFQCITWGSGAEDSSSSECGILGGGMAEGDVTLWSPSEVLRGAEGSAGASSAAGLLASVSVQRGERVQCLQFNSLRPSLLGAGCSSGGVSILDVEVVKDVVVYQPGAEHSGGGDGGECTCLSWNSSVAHILATGASSGQTVVWDLKQRKHAISFCDPSHRNSRPSSVLWLPSQPTQLLLFYDDDRNPTPQLWDLRNASFPLREARPQPPFGHSRGIVAAALCPADPRLVLTSGRDNRLVCWWLSEEALQHPQNSGNSGFEVYMQQETQESYVQLLWSPSSPGVYAAASPVHVSVCSLLASSPKAEPSIAGRSGGDFVGQTETLLGFNSSRIVPAWFRKPRSVDMTFLGDVAFSRAGESSVTVMRLLKDLAAADAGGEGEFSAEEVEAAGEVQRFDGVLRTQQWLDFCREKLEKQLAPEDEELWSALLECFEQNPGERKATAREALAARVEAFLGRPLPSTERRRSEQQRELERLSMQQQQQQQQPHPQMMGFSPQPGGQFPHPVPNGSVSTPLYNSAYAPPTAVPGVQTAAPYMNGVAPPLLQRPPSMSAVDPEKFFSQLGASRAEEDERQEEETADRQTSKGSEEVSAGQQLLGSADSPANCGEETRGGKGGVSGADFKTQAPSEAVGSQRGAIDWNAAGWSLVRECVLTGFVEGAVLLLASLGAKADALLLASAAAAGVFALEDLKPQRQGDNSQLQTKPESAERALWSAAAEAFVESVSDPFFKMVGSVVLGNLESVVESVPLQKWRDALRLARSFSRDEAEFKRLAQMLGRRLAAASDADGALVCLASAGDFPAACQLWIRDLQTQLRETSSHTAGGRGRLRATRLVLDRFHKMVALRAASHFSGSCYPFQRVALAYALEASALSCGGSAMMVLEKLLGTNAPPAHGALPAEVALHASAVELANRIFYANPAGMQQAGFCPPIAVAFAPLPPARPAALTSVCPNPAATPQAAPGVMAGGARADFSAKNSTPSFFPSRNQPPLQGQGQQQSQQQQPLIGQQQPQPPYHPPPHPMQQQPMHPQHLLQPQGSAKREAFAPHPTPGAAAFGGTNPPMHSSHSSLQTPAAGLSFATPHSSAAFNGLLPQPPPVQAATNAPSLTRPRACPLPPVQQTPSLSSGNQGFANAPPPPPAGRQQSGGSGRDPVFTQPQTGAVTSAFPHPPASVNSITNFNNPNNPTNFNNNPTPNNGVSAPGGGAPPCVWNAGGGGAQTQQQPHQQPPYPTQTSAPLPTTPAAAAAPPPFTAPTVGAQPLKPGMPVPWPIPTSAQLNQRTTRSTYAANVGINKAAERSGGGCQLPADQQSYVRNVLTGLLHAQQGQSGAAELAPRIEELFAKLERSELSGGACEKVISLCKSLETADYVQAQRLHAALSSTEWDSSNKNWLMALKRILPKA